MAAHSLGSDGPAGAGSSWHLDWVSLCLWDLSLWQELVKEKFKKGYRLRCQKQLHWVLQTEPKRTSSHGKKAQSNRSNSLCHRGHLRTNQGHRRAGQGLKGPKVSRLDNFQNKNSLTCHEIQEQRMPSDPEIPLHRDASHNDNPFCWCYFYISYFNEKPKKHLVENKFVTLIDHMAYYLQEKGLPFWKVSVSIYFVFHI